MKHFDSSDLKSCMLSKRANAYYLERCKIVVNGGRVEYITQQDKKSYYFNIPIANTTFLLLGNGTSVTQAAMRELGKAGVVLGFCGGGGTPLFSANEVDTNVSWMLPQSEYRVPEYLQKWVSFWFDDDKRLQAAKKFQIQRLIKTEHNWCNFKELSGFDLNLNESKLSKIFSNSISKINNINNVESLLTEEGRLTKILYKTIAESTKYDWPGRSKKGNGSDPANKFLDHGNYLAYGLAAASLWALGIPHSLPLLHGKTRRGGLVFDVADLIKDSTVLPLAFLAAQEGYDEKKFRELLLRLFFKTDSMDFMIDNIKSICKDFGEVK